MNFNFGSTTTSLHALANTYQMSGIEILNLVGSSNDITVGSAADVIALAGGHNLYIAGDASTTVHIDSSLWVNPTIVGSYTVIAFTGYEVGSPERDEVPASVRSSPGGYRTYHFWHSGYHGGK